MIHIIFTFAFVLGWFCITDLNVYSTICIFRYIFTDGACNVMSLFPLYHCWVMWQTGTTERGSFDKQTSEGHSEWHNRRGEGQRHVFDQMVGGRRCLQGVKFSLKGRLQSEVREWRRNTPGRFSREYLFSAFIYTEIKPQVKSSKLHCV